MKNLEDQYHFASQEAEIKLLKKDQLLDQAGHQKQKLILYGTIILLGLLLLSGFLFIARYRAVQKARRIIEIENLRNNIARNLHDDIGSTLTSINILSTVALKHAGNGSEAAGNLEKIKSRSSALMENMGDIVWAINPANDPLEKTVVKMEEFAAEMLEPAGIRFAFSEHALLGDLTLDVEKRKNLYLLFKEIINNIVKHSRATEVIINLQKNISDFVLTVADNGTGFNSSSQFAGNGLKNMQARAIEMKGNVTVNTFTGKGTTVTLNFPITR